MPRNEPQTVALSGTAVPFAYVGTPPTLATILDGQPDTFVINVALGPGSGTLTLSCSGLTASGVVVAGATCSFSDAMFPNPAATLSISQINNNTVQMVPVTVTITTTAAGMFPERWPKLPLDELRQWLPLSFIAILLLSLWMNLAPAPKRRARAAWVFLALVVLCGGWMSACGGASSGGSSTTATQTQPGMDTFTITGKLGNVTETINAVLNVTQ